MVGHPRGDGEGVVPLSLYAMDGTLLPALGGDLYLIPLDGVLSSEQSRVLPSITPCVRRRRLAVDPILLTNRPLLPAW